ncbi:MAG: M23 family peptidase [Sulfobacillus acidophilus]|uniref:M23 family peptidase n=1 Tax=Sulfobacillus acidophilus TaxID=53633 RepID=A0A2T2WF97_9FIRM|nr:MAG: M23 family peptidase [Sulfobacillus acidophilus]
MANRRTTIMGVVAGIVVLGGTAALVASQRPAAVTSSLAKPPVSSTQTRAIPTVGGPASAPLQMPVSGSIASTFGWQYSGTLNEWYYNPGITVAAHQGQPVTAAWSGMVTNVNREPITGLTVTVRDGDGFETVYGHLGSVSVKAGQTIRQGDVIGSVGPASLYSRTQGAHIDFQIYHKATATNPMNYLHPSS